MFTVKVESGGKTNPMKSQIVSATVCILVVLTFTGTAVAATGLQGRLKASNQAGRICQKPTDYGQVTKSGGGAKLELNIPILRRLGINADVAAGGNGAKSKWSGLRQQDLSVDYRNYRECLVKLTAILIPPMTAALHPANLSPCPHLNISGSSFNNVGTVVQADGCLNTNMQNNDYNNVGNIYHEMNPVLGPPRQH